MKNQRKQNQLSEADLTLLDRVQPQAIELENAILGALLISQESFVLVESILSADDFYSSINQTIYKSIERLSSKRAPIDMLTVLNELQLMGKLEEIGGPVYIAQLTENVASAAHIEFHAKIIQQKALSRKLINITGRIQDLAYNPSNDVAEVLEVYEKSFNDLNSKSANHQAIDMNLAIKMALSKIEQTQNDHESGKLIAIPTHLTKLTKTLEGGFRGPDLIILGGRPSMGKTQHALAIAKEASIMGQDCLFISIEMTAIQLVNRLILENDGISSFNMRTGQMSNEEWNLLDTQLGRINNLSLHIADNPNIRYLNNIKAEARRLHRQGLLKIMIIDYLQLVKTNMKFERRQLEVAYITGELKMLAKELNIPIIALSQLSRPPKGLKPKEPDLEDLREAGDIEQDADIVAFIHKPDYYDKDLKDWKGKGMFIIRKSREGARNDVIEFYHDDRYKKILDEPYYNNQISLDQNSDYIPRPVFNQKQLESSFSGESDMPF